MRLATAAALASLFLATSSVPAAAEDVVRRTANDGNVILEKVPEIPPALVERIDRYQNTRSAVFQAWDEAGDGLWIRTRFGETAQLHRVDRPRGARHQATFRSEPVAAAEGRPGHRELIYLMDRGGAEFYQLYLFDPTTAEHRLLTDGESRNGAAEWSRDGELLAFQSTRRDGAANDVWVMDPDDPATARLVLEAPDGAWWGPADWSADGERRAEYGDERDPEMRTHLEAISPANHPQRLTAPLFVLQGRNDPRVPVTEAEQIVAAVREAGYPVWYMNALDEGHGFKKKANRDLMMQAVVLFLEEHLAGGASTR